jgi:hypothetical protein
MIKHNQCNKHLLKKVVGSIELMSFAENKMEETFHFMLVSPDSLILYILS